MSFIMQQGGVGWVSLPITKHFFSFRERKSRDEFSKSLFLHINLICIYKWVLQPCPTSAQATLSKIQQTNTDFYYFSQSQHTFLTHLLFNQSAFATSLCCFHAVISTIHSSLIAYVPTAVIVHRTKVSANKRACSNRISGSVCHVRSVPYRASVMLSCRARRNAPIVRARSAWRRSPIKVRTHSRSLVTFI